VDSFTHGSTEAIRNSSAELKLTFFQSSGLSPARRRRMRDLSIPQDQASFPGTFVAKKLTVRL